MHSFRPVLFGFIPNFIDNDFLIMPMSIKIKPCFPDKIKLSIYVDTCQKAGGMVSFLLEHMF